MHKLIWITDPHLVEAGREWPAGVDPLLRLRLCLDEIRKHHADADRIVVSGDLIQIRNLAAYDILRRELDAMGTPYRLIAGNHDDRKALAAAFPNVPRHDGFIQYAEEMPGANLLFLDSVTRDGKHHGELCASRLGWIDERIAAADHRPLLIFLHHPPCDIGVPALDRLKLLDAAPLAQLLRRRRAPTFLLCGHLHRNVSGIWAGHPFASLKSTHVQYDLDMVASKLVRSTEPPGYGVIIVRGDDVVMNYRDVAVAETVGAETWPPRATLQR
mgnify:CR=1 FL=1